MTIEDLQCTFKTINNLDVIILFPIIIFCILFVIFVLVDENRKRKDRLLKILNDPCEYLHFTQDQINDCLFGHSKYVLKQRLYEYTDMEKMISRIKTYFSKCKKYRYYIEKTKTDYCLVLYLNKERFIIKGEYINRMSSGYANQTSFEYNFRYESIRYINHAGGGGYYYENKLVSIIENFKELHDEIKCKNSPEYVTLINFVKNIEKDYSEDDTFEIRNDKHSYNEAAKILAQHYVSDELWEHEHYDYLLLKYLNYKFK